MNEESVDLQQERDRWVLQRPDAAGRYVWDRWETQALSAGVAPELASLGRDVIQRWGYDGRAMLEQAQREPTAAFMLWTKLLGRL